MSYTSVNYINQLINYILLIVSVGGGFTCLLKTIQWISATEEGEVLKAKKDIKMILISIMVAISMKGLVTFISKTIGG